MGGGGGGSDREGGARLQLAADTVHVVHGSVEGEPHSFSDVEGASLCQLDSVQHLVDTEGSHLGSRKPLPEETSQCVRTGIKEDNVPTSPGTIPLK